MTALQKAMEAARSVTELFGRDEEVARAVLMAVREPTKEMLGAGGYVETGSAENHFMSEEIWQSMIDAILNEEPK